MSFNDLVSFFTYVIPGFVSTEIFRKRFPGKKGSDFSQLTWSITNSIFIFMIAQQLDNWLNWGLLPNNSGFPKIQTVIFFISLAVITAGIRIGFRELRKVSEPLSEKHKWLRFLRVETLAIWPIVNNTMPSKPSQWAYVTLSNGAKYLGWISRWTYDPNESDQDFLLEGARRLDDNFEQIYEIDGQGVYLKTSWIVSIEFFKGSEEKSKQQKTIDKAVKEVAPTQDKISS